MTSIIKKSYPVLGMSCSACASSVENVLKMQKGVIDAAVNIANAMAWIEFDPALTNAETLKAAINAVGFDLLITLRWR